LITISIVPTIIIVVGICVGFEMKNEAKILSIYGRAGALAEDVFSSMRNVHAFWAHPRLADKYDDLLLQARRAGRQKRPVYGVMFSTQFFCVNAGYGLAFWRGIHMYVNGEIKTSGSVVTVIFAVIVAAAALTQVAPQFLAITNATSAAHNLFEIIDRKSQVDSMSTAGQVPTQCKGEIELRNLQFHYPSRPDAPILQGINLKLPAGKTTALVGPSGSGKSTVIGMIERWYQPTAGSIMLDNIELNQLNIQWLRTNIRLVQQEPVLFNGTVFENVVYGLVGTEHVNAAKMDQMKLVEEACKAAFAHDFISDLPEGYDTQIGERAGRLSGGQKQRIAIARSIISNPVVLLLDEATSALDPKAEKIVQEALDRVSTSRTTLIIAHKLSTVRKADNIAVISKGVVVEQGTHEELIEKGGEYSRLVKAQDLQQKKEGDDTTTDLNNKEASKPDLLRLKTTNTNAANGEVQEDTEIRGFNYNLPKCLWILGKQQPHLYPWIFVVALISIIGGGVSPTVAVLFARAITAFQLPADQAISTGDFWALMLFVISIIVFIIYFSLGWSTAVVSQETTYFYRLQMFKDIMNQDLEFFDREENTTGALLSKLSSLPTDLQELIGFNVAVLITIMINIIASSLLAIGIGWKLGLTISLSALPVMAIFGYIRIRLEL
jgi:ATP-binding cassette subfamily B (MDR/TAP) protein 1